MLKMESSGPRYVVIKNSLVFLKASLGPVFCTTYTIRLALFNHGKVVKIVKLELDKMTICSHLFLMKSTVYEDLLNNRPKVTLEGHVGA